MEYDLANFGIQLALLWRLKVARPSGGHFGGGGRITPGGLGELAQVFNRVFVVARFELSVD